MTPRPPSQPTPVITAAAAIGFLVIIRLSFLAGRCFAPCVSSPQPPARSPGDGDLEHQVPASGWDEIDQLAQAFNRVADLLQASASRQHRLTGDVAHELHTLANLRGYLKALQVGIPTPPPPKTSPSRKPAGTVRNSVYPTHGRCTCEQ
ncbi:HAMP domain-containing protein [Streptomyces sp900105245]|uniref:HAMP domain-containing protein n=1 Tax=Streptomyces sp. 900105245 TaxID=3154379 RepID=A0ABV1ULM0_9ACTN